MEEEVGIVEHYFTKISVAAIKLTRGKLKIGDKIHVLGATTDFEQIVDSMEIDRKKIEEASAGLSVGIKIKERVREGDKVYRVTE
ncbi:MAG: translation elongation factor-like protein [Candidatus Thermoplasmatota archaeon]|nr:translation elongation factor-like protein [Candidatus Thermoplasmatota archaeon]